MASKITDAVLADMTALVPLDFFKAECIGEVHGVPAKSIIASATRRGLEYSPKPRVSKTGAPIVTKEDLLKGIGESLGFDTSGGEKATKAFLIALKAAIDG